MRPRSSGANSHSTKYVPIRGFITLLPALTPTRTSADDPAAERGRVDLLARVGSEQLALARYDCGREAGWIAGRGHRRADGDHEVVRFVDVVEVVEEARDLCGRGDEHFAGLDTLVVAVRRRADHGGFPPGKNVRFPALRRNPTPHPPT